MLLYDARYIARKLDGEQFDKILLDAPCSVEGLLHLDDAKAFTTWSVAAIRRLQALQRRMLSEAWQLLKPGGTLVYSTCTIAPEENEQVVAWLLRRDRGAQLAPIAFQDPARVSPLANGNGKPISPYPKEVLRLAPSHRYEAFIVAKLQKRTANTDDEDAFYYDTNA